jgi:hypothetical protein
LREAIHGSVRHVPAACNVLEALAGIVPAAVAEPRTALMSAMAGVRPVRPVGGAKARTF